MTLHIPHCVGFLFIIFAFSRKETLKVNTMKLEKILERLNSLEKGQFLKIINNLSSAEKNNLHVEKIIIVAPDFSEDFVADCGDEFSLPITLLKAGSLAAIYHTVKETGTNRFTFQMLSRDILVQEDRIIRALNNKR